MAENGFPYSLVEFEVKGGGGGEIPGLKRSISEYLLLRENNILIFVMRFMAW
jgi:hypothetical protein